jgi:hypothetical protein
MDENNSWLPERERERAREYQEPEEERAQQAREEQEARRAL